MVSHWGLTDSKSPKVSWTLLSILADLNKAVVWMVSIPPIISKISSPYTISLLTVSRVPITIGINITFMFQSFFQFSSKVQVLIFHFAFFQFYSVVSRDSKVHNSASSLFFCCWLFLVLVVWPRLVDYLYYHHYYFYYSKSETCVQIIFIYIYGGILDKQNY